MIQFDLQSRRPSGPPPLLSRPRSAAALWQREGEVTHAMVPAPWRRAGEVAAMVAAPGEDEEGQKKAAPYFMLRMTKRGDRYSSIAKYIASSNISYKRQYL